MKTYTHALLAIAITATIAGPVLAEESNCTTAPQSKWISMDDVKATAISMGYDVRGIKKEGTCYEAKAIIDGHRREIVFNPETGKLVDGDEQG